MSFINHHRIILPRRNKLAIHFPDTRRI
jgi:hypothetical protein